MPLTPRSNLIGRALPWPARQDGAFYGEKVKRGTWLDLPIMEGCKLATSKEIRDADI